MGTTPVQAVLQKLQAMLSATTEFRVRTVSVQQVAFDLFVPRVDLDHFNLSFLLVDGAAFSTAAVAAEAAESTLRLIKSAEHCFALVLFPVADAERYLEWNITAMQAAMEIEARMEAQVKATASAPSVAGSRNSASKPAIPTDAGNAASTDPSAGKRIGQRLMVVPVAVEDADIVGSAASASTGKPAAAQLTSTDATAATAAATAVLETIRKIIVALSKTRRQRVREHFAAAAGKEKSDAAVEAVVTAAIRPHRSAMALGLRAGSRPGAGEADAAADDESLALKAHALIGAFGSISAIALGSEEELLQNSSLDPEHVAAVQSLFGGM